MSAAAERLALQNLRPSCNVLGIDLGTTNAVVAIWMAGEQNPEVLTVENNERIIPSYVWCKADGTFDVGRNAVRNWKQFPQDVCYDAKRMIGQNFTNLTQLQSDYWSFKIVNNNGRPAYELSNGKLIEPEEISVQVLKKAEAIADAYACANLEYAVITVPAYFDQNQKQATIDAAKRAGLTVLQLETEPTAAAFAFNYDHKRFDDYNLFVFDLGGGTFDITIISIKDGRFNVEACGGNNFLGGRDFDNLLMKDLRRRLEEHGAKNLNDVKQKIRLRALAETTKVALTTCDKEIVNCSDFIANATDKDGMFEITSAEFEKLAFQLKGFLRDACLEAMKKANLTSDEFANVFLIGGSSRMPMVSQLLNELFPQSFDSIFYQSKGLNPDEAVAYGAAIRAAQLSDPNHRDYKPMENLLPIGIGIGLPEDQYSLIFAAGTKYPTRKKKRYFTTENNQKSMYFDVYEGEWIQASEKREILSFVVPDLPPGLAGHVYVDVTYGLDNNGFLTVTGKSATSTSVVSVDYRRVRQSGRRDIKPLVFKEIMSSKFGIEYVDENGKSVFKNIFDSNTPYHQVQVINLTTTKNDQKGFEISFYEGMYEEREKNTHIGSMKFRNLATENFKNDIRFTIDEDGTVEISHDNTSVQYRTHLYDLQKPSFQNEEKVNAAGIDFGNTTCFAAIARNNDNEAITLGNNNERALLSYVSYDERDEKCGRGVVNRMLWHAKSTIYDIKKIIGKDIESIEIDDKWPFKIIKTNTSVYIEIESFTGQILKDPEDAMADMLKYIKEKLSEENDKRNFKEIVLSIPANLNDKEKEAILKAAELAELKNVILLPDPISAFYSYYMTLPNFNKYIILIFDLGGTSLDLSVLRVIDNEIDILKTCSNSNLGGRYFNTVLKNFIENFLITEKNCDLNEEKKLYKIEMHVGKTLKLARKIFG